MPSVSLHRRKSGGGFAIEHHLGLDAVIPLPEIEDDRKAQDNPLNANFAKTEFHDLWKKINRKAACTVHFETDELTADCCIRRRAA